MIIYYIEVNLICMVILILFRLQFQYMKTFSMDQRLLNALSLGTVLFCLSDVFAGILRGRLFPGARAVIELSNLVYFESLVLVSFLWGEYVHVRLTKSYVDNRRSFIYRAIPAIIFTLLSLSNPWTHILFRINEENLYERSIGVYIHWIIVWAYFMVAFFKTWKVYRQENSRMKRQEIVPLLYFMIAPAIASIVQMLFYGVTSTQVGITISIVMICLSCQDTQILTDALTGINNRRGFDNYFMNSIQHSVADDYTLIMIDVDRFKHINDRYGHMIGDVVLKNIADALKQACKLEKKRLHLCRFGGDEFCILGIDCKLEEVQKLKTAIRDEISLNAKEQHLPCSVSVSIGSATGRCTTENDLKELLNKADQAMYEEKQRKK